MTHRHRAIRVVVSVLALAGFGSEAFGQAEVYAWGGLRGIRVDGDLIAFTTGIRAVSPDSPVVGSSNAERLGSPRFSRDGNRLTCSGSMASGRGARAGGFGGRGPASGLNGRIVFEDISPGAVNVDVQVTASADTTLAGIYFYIHLSGVDYAGGTAQLVGAKPPADAVVSLKADRQLTEGRFLSGTAKGIRLSSTHRQLEVAFDAPKDIVVQADRSGAAGDLTMYFPVSKGSVAAGQIPQLSFMLKVSGDADKTPVKLVIDANNPGSPFDGIGGNFRLQNPRSDPPIIQYNLENLRVAWARVRMALDQWQPNETEDPIQAAKEGRLNSGVRGDMEMARTLTQRNIPFIISVWSAPRWALSANAAGPGGFGRASRVNPDKWDNLCSAIGSYLEYMKQKYGAEPKFFSFNESDIGIYVLQSPQEHAEAIKRLGTHFASRGLSTKMLLGDTGNPTGTEFIKPAIEDPEARKYIGAVSFHSWHGGTDAQLKVWGDAAKKLNLPLFSAEGGTDPDAWNYPAIFEEPWFALDEIRLYVRICVLSQPRSVIHWQLTADYSVLAGGGNEPLHPTQRFWNLKQLGATPAGSKALPITSDRSAVLACAYVNSGGTYTMHLVNTGVSRPAAISGLPASGIKEFRVYVTDATRGMKELPRIPISAGTAQLTLEPATFTTLISVQ